MDDIEHKPPGAGEFEPRTTSPRRRSNDGRNLDNAHSLEIAERRAKVSSMIKAGANYRQIADKLGVSLGTVASDKAAIMEEWQRYSMGALHEHILLDLQRLEDLILQLTSDMRAYPEDPRFRAVYLAALKRKSDLLGLDSVHRDRQPIAFPELDKIQDVRAVALDHDGNPITDKSPAARIFALLGGKRQGGAGQQPGDHDGDRGSGGGESGSTA